MSPRRLPRLTLAVVAAVLLSLGLSTGGATASSAQRFTDVPPTHTFYEHITFIAGEGFVQGYPDGTFRPNTALTRGQFAVIVYNSSYTDDYTPPKRSPFKDVPTSHSFYKHIAYLNDAGVIDGFSDGTFRPNAPLTRGQLAVILYNPNGGPAPSRPTFSDVPRSHTFYRHVEQLVDRGVVNGYPDGTFRPNTALTRGQLAVIVFNSFRSDRGADALRVG